MEVSILVFLDMEFRHFHQNQVGGIHQCFNPCFSGYGIQTFWLGFFALYPDSGFNPCFSGYGIQTPVQTKPIRQEGSFNPCFSGYGIQTTFLAFMVSSSDLFQSLFFWIWNSDLCCRERKGLHQVVSILVFLDMEFRLEESPLGNIATRKFQSLFFWIWNSDLWYEFEFPLPRGFQSLFFWIWNSDNRYQETTSLLSEVSILVFLDMEFRLLSNISNPPCLWVSILVFLDMEFRHRWNLQLLKL